LKLLRIAIIVLLFIFIGAQLVHNLTSINQDIGRHLKMGEIVWQTKSVPKINLFSFTEPGYPFINHHWLSEVVFFILNGVIGLRGLILFKTAVILAAFGIIFAALYKKTGLWPLLLASLVGIIVFDRTDVRPEIFSYLFLAFFLFAIFRAKYGKETKWLYTLPFIQILWTNMHIYFALGPGLLFLFLIDRAAHEKDKYIIKKVGLIFFLTAAATLLNPNFIKGALQPFMILKDYGYSIVENQSIFFLKDYGALLTPISLFEFSLIALILSFVVAIKNGARKITFELLAALVFAVLGARMIRNFGIYALTFVPIIALNLSIIRLPVLLASKKAKIVLMVLTAIILGWLTANVVNNKYFKWLGGGKKFGLEIPAGAANGVEFVKQNNIKGPVFNNFDVGSFLIWKLYPEQKVFVDGRPEAYGVEFFENIYKPMMEDPGLWKKYSEIYKINYVFMDYRDITPWARQFLLNISQDPSWPLVYKDGSVAIFLKRTPENFTLIKKF
jgi:hypothetical protein